MGTQQVVDEVKEFAGAHRRLAAEVAVALLLLFIGLAVGRFTGTPKVVEKETVKTVYQDKIVYQDRIVEKKVFVEVEKKHEHVDTVETKKPDGTVVTETKRDTDTNTGINETTDKDSTRTVTETKYVTQIIEKTKMVLKQPDWSVYAGAGVDIPHFLGQPQHGAPGLQGFVIQAGVDRRIAGPFWAGIFGNTEGVVGLNLRGTW